MFKKKSLLVALACPLLALAGASAQAATHAGSWDSVTSTPYKTTYAFSESGITDNGFFSFIYDFSVGGPSTGYSWLSTVLSCASPKGKGCGVGGINFALWKDGSQVHDFASSGKYSFATAGDYELRVGAHGLGNNIIGSFNGDLTVSAVPEPGEWALMLSGLGLMGYLVRRRQNAAA